jgi:hypothetical protein
MTEAASPEGKLDMTPNELLIIAAIGAYKRLGRCSPKSDYVAWSIGKNAAWVHRHGKKLSAAGVVDLSMNGHVSLMAEGYLIDRRMAAEVPGPIKWLGVDTEADLAKARLSLLSRKSGMRPSGRSASLRMWQPRPVVPDIHSGLSDGCDDAAGKKGSAWGALVQRHSVPEKSQIIFRK